jgi:HicB_like antitoxin of bacterial toxin-antitoxin system
MVSDNNLALIALAMGRWSYGALVDPSDSEMGGSLPLWPGLTWLDPAMTKRPISRTDSTRYAVVIEKGERNYSAYVPDLPGCVSVGDTLEDVKAKSARRHR